MYTQKQVEQWKKKAEKWDALDEQISKFYREDADEEGEDLADQHDGDLMDIGEAAARAFGYM